MAASVESPLMPQNLPPPFMMVKQEVQDPAYNQRINMTTDPQQAPPAKPKRKYVRKPKGENGEAAPARKKVKNEPVETPDTQQKITDHMPVQKRKRDRFKGMTEEEVLQRVLPDHTKEDLDILIVGINPGLTAAFIQHHYAGPGNHFWKCLYLSGMIPEPMNAMQDAQLLDYGIGFTNIVERTTRGSADLTRKEIAEGGVILKEKVIRLKPKIALFNGKGIYEVFCGKKDFYFGLQPEPFPGVPGTVVFVNPSSSARCTQLPRAVDKVPFYEALKRVRNYIRENGSVDGIDRSTVTFPDFKLVTAPQKVKKEIKEEPGVEGQDGGEVSKQITTTNGEALPPAASVKPRKAEKPVKPKAEKPVKPKAVRRGRPTKKQQAEAAAAEATAAAAAAAQAQSSAVQQQQQQPAMQHQPPQQPPITNGHPALTGDNIMIKHEVQDPAIRNDFNVLLQQQQQQQQNYQQQQHAAAHQLALEQQQRAIQHHAISGMMPMSLNNPAGGMPSVKQERHDFGQYGVMPGCPSSTAPSSMAPYPLYNGYWNYLQCATTASMMPATTMSHSNIRPQISIPPNNAVVTAASNHLAPSTPNNPIIPQEASSPTMSNQSSLTQASLESLPKADSSLTVANWLQTIPPSQ